MNKPSCCYLYPTIQHPEGDPFHACRETAEWVIEEEDSYTSTDCYSCTPHVGYLLGTEEELDGGKMAVFRVWWVGNEG